MQYNSLTNIPTDAEVLSALKKEADDLEEEVVSLQKVVDTIAAEMCESVSDVLKFEEAYGASVSADLFEEFQDIEKIRKEGANA